MQPTKAVTIVIVALILTGMCGYFLQPTHEEVTKTTYDYKGDLTPSVIYSKIDDWTEYNPLSNVTGWRQLAGTTIPQSTVATPYVLDPAIYEYVSGTINPTSSETSTVFYFMFYDKYNKSDFSLDTDGVVLIAPDDGGFAFRNVPYPTPSGKVPYVSKTSYSALVWDISTQKFAPAEWDSDQGIWVAVGTAYDYTQWGIYSNLKDSSNKYIPLSVEKQVPNRTAATYVDPTQFVKVDSGATAKWVNGQENGVINILASKNAVFTLPNITFTYTYSQGSITKLFTFVTQNVTGFTEGDYVLENGEKHPLTVHNTGGGIVQYQTFEFTDNSGLKWTIAMTGVEMRYNYSTLHYDTWYMYSIKPESATQATSFDIKADNLKYTTISIPSDIPYDTVLCTLDFINNKFTCKGVSSLNNTLSYTVADYDYNLITNIPVVITSEARLQVSATNGGIITLTSTLYSDINAVMTDGRSYNLYYTTFAKLKFANTASSGTLTVTYPSGSGTDSFTVNPGESSDFTVNYSNDSSITVTYADGSYTHSYVIHAYKTNSLSGLPRFQDGFSPVSVKSLSVKSSDTSEVKVFVDSTTVAVDPSGILWGDPKMPLAYFYPEQMQYDTRILFNGFVKYGDSITLNGTVFPVSDGYLLYTHTVTQEGEEVTVTDSLPLKGMAIDYIKKPGESQFKVYLVFTERGDYTIDLGNLDTTTVSFNYTVSNYNPNTGSAETITKTVETYVGYLVSATGNWYWQSGAYSISTTTSDNIGLDLESANFGLSLTASCLLMLFFMIISTAAMYRFTEIEFCTMDWVVLICVSFLLIGVAIM